MTVYITRSFLRNRGTIGHVSKRRVEVFTHKKGEGPGFGCLCITLKDHFDILNAHFIFGQFYTWSWENGRLSFNITKWGTYNTIQYRILIGLTIYFLFLPSYFHLEFADSTSAEHARKRLSNGSMTVPEFGYFLNKLAISVEKKIVWNINLGIPKTTFIHLKSRWFFHKSKLLQYFWSSTCMRNDVEGFTFLRLFPT